MLRTLAACLTLLLFAAGAAPAATLTTLVNFNSANGAYPDAGVTFDALGNLYGTTLYGGSTGYGTLYSYNPGTSTLTNLVDFNYTIGAYPYGEVTFDALGNLYGTTYWRGSPGVGILYSYNPGASTLTTLVNFNFTNGGYPRAGVTFDALGNLYGTTQFGGPTSVGNLYSYNPGTSTLTTLVNFNNANGAQPIAEVTFDALGNLYGTTYAGGSSGDGTLFSYNLGTSTLTTLVNFNGANGEQPLAGVTIDALGILYGTTYSGGAAGWGTLYSYNPATGTLSTLVNFDGTNGARPVAGVTFDALGILYGTTSEGGTSDYGTLYSYNPATSTLTTLVNFNFTNGGFPYAGVTFDALGNLYGTTYGGGTSGRGTLYHVDLGHGPGPVVPEPASLALVGAALALLATLRRR